MIEQYKRSLISQYHAALSMLSDCISKCPEANWNGNVGSFPFWHVVYHALFYTDMYLSPDLDSFAPPGFHRENYQYFGRLPWPPHEIVLANIPYDKETLLEYVQHCRDKTTEAVGAETIETLEGACGFWWYKIPRSEFHVNNIRHIQHHTAQISLYLRISAGVEIQWS